MWDIVAEYGIFLAIAGFFVFVFLSLLLVGCLEKQRIRDFALAPPETLPPASPYFRAMNEAARALGYQPGEVAGQNRNSSTYRCCLALWLSPDQRSLLCIGGGKLARFNYKRTIIFSRLANDRILKTLDECGSEDLSGTCDVELLLNAHLPELHAFHQQRLLTAGVSAVPFSSTNLLAQFEELNEKRVEALVRRGLAKFSDPQCNTFRYTFKGAFINATSGYFKGLSRAQAQQDRTKKKRPGS